MSTEIRAPLSRRKLLAALAAGFTAVAAIASPALHLSWTRRPGKAGSWWNRQSFSLAKAGMNEWSQQVGSDFTVRAEGGAAAVRLESVKPLMSAGRRPAGLARDRAFEAVFASAAGTALPAGDRMYPVNHSKYGAMDVYFSPSGQKMGAVFN